MYLKANKLGLTQGWEILEIANCEQEKTSSWKLRIIKIAFPCIKQTLNSNTTRADIIAVQLWASDLQRSVVTRRDDDDKELKLAFSALNLNEKRGERRGILSINKAIKKWMK